MRVPMMSAGTRSGVNCNRANLPPTTVARVSTASVLATPGTPSSSTWPRASRATSIRSTSRSWPTITRLISNRARSMRAASTDGGTGAPAPAATVLPDGLSRGVLAALLTWLPGAAGSATSLLGGAGDGTACPSEPVSYRLLSGCRARATARRARATRPRAQPAAAGSDTASLGGASGSSPRGCPTPHAKDPLSPPLAAGLCRAPSGAGPDRSGVAGPPDRRDLDDVAALRCLDDLVPAQVDRHVVDRRGVRRIGGPEDQVAALQVGLGHLGQGAELRPAVAWDQDPGPVVGVLRQAAAVEADDVG